MSGEIITISLGGYANHVGAHFWNIQDELLGYTEKEGWEDLASTINPSVLFSIKEDRTVRPGC